MGRHNHARHGRQSTFTTRGKPRFAGLPDELADRQQRERAMRDWIADHRSAVLAYYDKYQQRGVNSLDGLVICHQCAHHIARRAPVLTTKPSAESSLIAFHWSTEGENCWTDFTHHLLRQKAEEALYGLGRRRSKGIA